MSPPSASTWSPDSDGIASTGCAPSTSTSSTPRSSTPATPPPPCCASTASCPARSLSPCSGVTSPATSSPSSDPPAQKQSDVATALEVGEARAVLAAAARTRNPARWTVALALGLRQSEALALQWKDIDLLTGTLTVRRSIHRVRGGGLIYEEPKTRRSQRTLTLPMPLVGELHQHKAAQLAEQMLAGSEWQDEDLVFAQPNGRPIDKKTDHDDWTRLLHKAGVRHVRLHDGRHTAATLPLSENVHPRVVMELLGHS
ncbi:site-specific integrase [Modestobacter versicolor]|uniref:Integrase n=1 Tax=Modestobacter versicolor TaxID=429133 RepID=A0A323VDP9_9ACTN|nr:site-specific integrase [Modestobacter versicolor]MBB3676227.1 integrase [Modestobacter versicolor]PZA22330.1 hypothetical protein DMO24_05665 [Modestobacter versicolor]